jgi:tripartite-type tricarboxylate transporter receptor subunit TctC
MQLGAKRMASLKDTQTAIEAGFDGFTAEAWWGVFAPKGTPSAVIASIETAIRETLAEPEIAKRLTETQEMTLVLSGPAAFDTFFKAEMAAWGKVVRENGIKAQ